MIARPSFRKIALAGAALLSSPAAFADDASWISNAASTWATGSNWDTGSAPGATTGTTNTDTATFSQSAVTAARTVTVDASRNIQNITFDIDGLTGNYTPYTINGGPLLLTSGGLLKTEGTTNNTGVASGASFSVASITVPSVILQGNYTFSADTSNVSGSGFAQFFIGGAATVSGASGLGAVALTLTGSAVQNTNTTVGDQIAGATGGVFNGSIADGSGTVVSVVKEGTGAWQFNKANAFTGGLTIKQGSIFTSNDQGLGNGGVTLGETGSAQNAYVLLGSSRNVANSLTVNSGVGLHVLGANAVTGDTTYSGAITLNGGANLRLQKASANSLVVSGGITGTGDVEVYNNASAGTGAAKGVVFSTAAINNVGKVTNASPGTGTLTQTAGGIIGANVTEFIQNSATSTTTLSLANAYGATRVLAGTLATTGTGTLGTGDVVVNGGSLILGSSISLSDTAVLRFIESDLPTITLNNLTADTVYAIYDITTGASINANTWTAADLNGFFGTNVFTGTGQLTTVAAVPEPGTMGLVFFALGLAVIRLRHRLHFAR